MIKPSSPLSLDGEVLKTDRLTIITDDAKGSEKSDLGDIAIVPLWKWLLGETEPAKH